MITTDNHLGYKEEDPILKMDSFDNFEKALVIAKTHEADCILQLGDLFHVSEPSNRTIHLTINILEKNLGRSNIKENVLNIPTHAKSSIPFIMINGNHDRPTQIVQNSMEEDTSCLDLLEKFGVTKYIGKELDKGVFEIPPFLINKGDIALAVYGIGYQKDDKLNTLFQHKKIKFLDCKEATHRVLIVHQNRPSLDNPFSSKDTFNFTLVQDCGFDLILWGHEHETFNQIYVHEKTGQKIYQPGSTIATSLSKSEQPKKCVGIIDFS